MGEPAGIGLDITLAAWVRRREADLPPFYLAADIGAVEDRAAHLGVQVPISEVSPGSAFDAFPNSLPVVPLSQPVAAKPGCLSAEAAPRVIESIDAAVGHVLSGQAAAVVTNPIHKKALYDAGFAFPGHTEYLAELAGRHSGETIRPVMMLAGPALRVVPVTIHIPLADVIGALTTQAIIETGEIVARELRERLGISRPRLAIAGVNPHAGEEGGIGGEDIAIIKPAVEALVSRGIEARGPLPADTMFHEAARAQYDVALAMYHDQALIPAKTLGFDDTVNITLGLPFVRTSPDHGTALDIAGSGMARPDSLIAALKLAREMAPRETDR